MKLIIDSDPSGMLRAGQLWQALHSSRHAIIDGSVGAAGSGGLSQYPDIAYRLAVRVAAGEFKRGILVCKTGMGMAIVANKVPGIFAGVCRSVTDAHELADARGGNIMVIGVAFVPEYLALCIVEAWLRTPFGARANLKRLREIDQLTRRPSA